MKSEEVLKQGLEDARQRYEEAMKKAVKTGIQEDFFISCIIEVQYKTLKWVIDD